MRDTNVVILSGNLVADPKTRPNGPTVVRIGVTRNYRDRSGEWKSQSSYFDVVAWRDVGEAAQTFRKGERITVTGSLRMNEWSDQQGNKRRDYTILADEISRPVVVERQGHADESRPQYPPSGWQPPAPGSQYEPQQQGGGDYPEW